MGVGQSKYQYLSDLKTFAAEDKPESWKQYDYVIVGGGVRLVPRDVQRANRVAQVLLDASLRRACPRTRMRVYCSSRQEESE